MDTMHVRGHGQTTRAECDGRGIFWYLRYLHVRMHYQFFARAHALVAQNDYK